MEIVGALPRSLFVTVYNPSNAVCARVLAETESCLGVVARHEDLSTCGRDDRWHAMKIYLPVDVKTGGTP